MSRAQIVCVVMGCLNLVTAGAHVAEKDSATAFCAVAIGCVCLWAGLS